VIFRSRSWGAATATCVPSRRPSSSATRDPARVQHTHAYQCGRKFLAVTYLVHATSRAQLDAIYRELTACKSVIDGAVIGGGVAGSEFQMPQ